MYLLKYYIFSCQKINTKLYHLWFQGSRRHSCHGSLSQRTETWERPAKIESSITIRPQLFGSLNSWNLNIDSWKFNIESWKVDMDRISIIGVKWNLDAAGKHILFVDKNQISIYFAHLEVVWHLNLPDALLVWLRREGLEKDQIKQIGNKLPPNSILDRFAIFHNLILWIFLLHQIYHQTSSWKKSYCQVDMDLHTSKYPCTIFLICVQKKAKEEKLDGNKGENKGLFGTEVPIWVAPVWSSFNGRPKPETEYEKKRSKVAKNWRLCQISCLPSTFCSISNF